MVWCKWMRKEQSTVSTIICVPSSGPILAVIPETIAAVMISGQYREPNRLLYSVESAYVLLR